MPTANDVKIGERIMIAGTLSITHPSSRRKPNTIKKITIGLDESDIQIFSSVCGSSSLATIHDIIAPPAIIKNIPALAAPDLYKIAINPYQLNAL